MWPDVSPFVPTVLGIKENTVKSNASAGFPGNRQNSSCSIVVIRTREQMITSYNGLKFKDWICVFKSENSFSYLEIFLKVVLGFFSWIWCSLIMLEYGVLEEMF